MRKLRTALAAASALALLAVGVPAALADTGTPAGNQAIIDSAVAAARTQVAAQNHDLPPQRAHWKVLFLAFTDVTYTSDGFHATMDADARTYARTMVDDFGAALEDNTGVTIDPTLTFVTDPITLDTGGDRALHERGPVADAINANASLAQYDSIITLTKDWTTYYGVTLPKYYSDTDTAGSAYSYADLAQPRDMSAYPGKSPVTPSERATEITLHEFAHQLSFAGLGFTYPDVHGAGSYGYTDEPLSGWTQFYLDFFAGTVSSGGKQIGVYPSMWSLSPRFLHRPAAVTVHYVDAAGASLRPDATAYGPGGDAYAFSAPAIDGYRTPTVLASGAPQSGSYATGVVQELTYVYAADPVAAAPVTVRHVSAAGESVSPDVILTGDVGAPYTTTPAAVTGWTLSTAPDNAAGTFGSTAQTVTYVYTADPVAAAPVTVRHVSDTGASVAEDVVLSGELGAAYTTTPATVTGWTLTATPDNATGTFGATAQTVTYVYTAVAVAAAPVTVHHVSAAGETVAPDVVLTGAIGDEYTAKPVTAAGWNLTATPANATGAFGFDPQTVTFVYTPVTVAAAPVTVRHVSTSGATVADDVTLTGNVGDPYTSRPVTLAGWTPGAAPANATGLFGPTAQTVTYVYTPAVAPVVPVTPGGPDAVSPAPGGTDAPAPAPTSAAEAVAAQLATTGTDVASLTGAVAVAVLALIAGAATLLLRRRASAR